VDGDVEVAGQEGGEGHLLHAAQRLGDRLELVQLHLQADHHPEVIAETGGIGQHGELDDAALLQAIHPPANGRLRDAGGAADLGVGHPRVLLERPDDRAVGIVDEAGHAARSPSV
jgi:hypothetical protein